MTTLSARVAAVLREAVPDFSWWDAADKRRETVVGLTGAVLVIPQAITFAYLVGVSPEYGLYCAVFVALVSSLLGSSAMVGGPNTALSILLSLSVMPYAGRGSPLYTDYVILLTLMVGVIQLVLWLLRGAEIFRYLSPAAIGGIKMGVGVLLITSALEGTLGVSGLAMQFFYEKFYVVATEWSEIVNPWAAVVSGSTVVAALALRPRYPRVYIIVALLVGWVTGAIINGWIGPARSEVELLGRVVFHPWPFQVPTFSKEYFMVMEELLPAALAIAVLGLAQSLVIARDLKTLMSPEVNLHKEVCAQGVSNVVGAFFSSFAGSGSFNRTSVAVGMGTRNPMSGLVAGVAVAAIAWGLGPFLTTLPMPAIAAVLLLVGVGMIQWKEIRLVARSRIDSIVCGATVFTVCFVGLEAGILVAGLLSVVFFVASASEVSLDISHEGGHEHIAARGNLFYASLDSLANHLRAHPSNVTRLDLTRVPYCDSAAWSMIDAVRRERESRGGRLEIVRDTRGGHPVAEAAS
ncbi:MAG: SulP family inorganic anion transporter [Burkholderiales bacterium]